ncbi:ABC transporter ATP-binding protein [Acetanaerobacterium elongatum]|uniref:Amino acid/amide ABC transporter ATP-binding protein 2, HAAT family n=1 Tax=Acetanaerobacterium elongatum TaxID=258515 RepID=A0A1H0FFF6_9FIRM|nr:ABC transporter ATP-binding protein [Acetanaerobacterium elongatum]SDN93415.1 amino acid/amide ABC transporter ATP-binding protein 2, HAAT family [Acetanaerobacterium elongatum]
MLKVENLEVYYGSIHAIHGVNFEVKQGEIVTLIGANGAGKTTILQTITGMIKSKAGEITFLEKNLKTIEPHRILQLGLAHVPEGRRIFSGLTVMENLQMGAYIRNDGKAAIDADYERVFTTFPRLKERKSQLAGTLSGGEQQMLAISRAIMAKPKMMLLDEPSMGLSPILVQEIFKIVKDVNASGVTVLLVEQNANMALSIADRAYVLETGHIVKEGSAQELKNDSAIQKAYLGS